MFHVYTLLSIRHSSRMAFIAIALAASAPAMAAIVDDFSGYTAGNPLGTPWTDIDNSTSGEPVIASDGNNIAGNHVRHTAGYPWDTVGRSLPNALTADGDYLQIAINVVSGNTLATLIMDGAAFGGGGSNVPLAAIGIETHHKQFSTAHSSVYDTGDFYLPGGTQVSLGTWYYLRATMRDAVGADGIIDSYDFQVYSDASATSLLAQRLNISFGGSGAGPITHIALRQYEQSGVSPFATVLFDEITTNAVPEPSSALLLLASAGLLRHRRRA